ncbi:hypothetical protein NQ314_005550 [Rhamnusium bicolor]|uniref:Uncharacterized protein n=1 Tax=Rhamnusium bicolor TaxID=1586634 RepID=A0AAV8ZGU2_9CUCU|nr:hypothetical protein NQ314_005550 [Rhamnusium bicolor]
MSGKTKNPLQTLILGCHNFVKLSALYLLLLRNRKCQWKLLEYLQTQQINKNMSDPENWGEDDDNDPDYVPPGEMENGHITQSSNSNTEESDSSDDENPASSNNGQFDTDLPTAHRYLGKLNNVSGYTLYDDGEIIDILAIYTTTMVFPGFTLPLLMNNYVETTIMQNFIEKNKVFVLLCANTTFNGIYNFGVTMEIFETQMRNNVLNIKARGRQRCKLVPGCEIKNWAGRLKQVTIKIIADPEITTPPLYHLAQYPIPSWVYDKYEISYCVKLLLDGLSHYVGGKSIVINDWLTLE